MLQTFLNTICYWDKLSNEGKLEGKLVKLHLLVFVEVATGAAVADQDDDDHQGDQEAEDDQTPEQSGVLLLQQLLENNNLSNLFREI